jgi:plastocyanin
MYTVEGMNASKVSWLVAGLAAALSAAHPGYPAAARDPGTPPKVAAGPGTGTLTGTVVVRGRLRKARRVFNPYAQVYGPSASSPTGLPRHLCVYLEDVPGAWHPPAGHEILGQRNREFTTDLLPVLRGTDVDFVNYDRFFHNIFSYSRPNDFDLGRRGSGETVTRTFSELPPRGIAVVSINCEIHANMKSTILVMRNPFWQLLPETGGTFRLEGLPPGTYRLTGWHVSLAPRPVTVTVKDGHETSATLVMQGEE